MNRNDLSGALVLWKGIPEILLNQSRQKQDPKLITRLGLRLMPPLKKKRNQVVLVFHSRMV